MQLPPHCPQNRSLPVGPLIFADGKKIMSIPHVDETLVAICATKATELENRTCAHKHALGRRVGRGEVMEIKRGVAPKTRIDPLSV
jgi:hypothetical protein